jgi:transketolase
MPLSRDFDLAKLQHTARELRCDIIRMLAKSGSGHPGGSLSAIDMITYLYWHQMRIDPANPQWEDRDRFVLSKGHCAPALYVALANTGYFPKEVLWTLRDVESPLQGHPDMRKTRGVDMTTGSLGQGFSAAAGIALGGKVRKKDFKVYVMLSDGELQEGVVWEAAMAAGHYHLDNLIALIDDNRLQTDGPTAEIMNPNPIAEKWKAFGWDVFAIDGHNFREIHDAVQKCMIQEGRPHVIVAQTVKGKGVTSQEGNPEWHSLAKPMTEEEMERYLAELSQGAQP